jgi:hypothetical protein
MFLLVAFSFGKRRENDNEPGPANRRIAGSVLRVVDAILHDGKGPVVVVAEWEVALALGYLGFNGDQVIPVYQYEVLYRGREAVWEKAREELIANSYEAVAIVTSRLNSIKKSRVYKVEVTEKYGHLMRRTGYDRRSEVSYAKGPLRYLWYRCRNLVGKIRRRRYYWAED